MKRKEIDVGVYRIKFAVYKTGNVYVRFVNRITGEETTLKVRNPLAPYKKVNSVHYRI